jgi:(2Fe-2S) ferredoxin
VVYPEGVWYGFTAPADAEEIVESHLVNGRPVERLRLPDGCINTSHCPHKKKMPRPSEPSAENQVSPFQKCLTSDTGASGFTVAAAWPPGRSPGSRGTGRT